MTIVPVQTSQEAPACASVDPEVFYQRKQLRTALETCGGCPMRDMCLREELRLPIRHQHGVRGGLTAPRRKEILRSWREAGYTLPSSPAREAIATVVELSSRRPAVEPVVESTFSAVAA